MTDTVTSQNIELSFWNTLYNNNFYTGTNVSQEYLK
jgi:hypothetical protein